MDKKNDNFDKSKSLTSNTDKEKSSDSQSLEQSKEELFQLKKELEAKKKLLEQKLNEIGKSSGENDDNEKNVLPLEKKRRIVVKTNKQSVRPYEENEAENDINKRPKLGVKNILNSDTEKPNEDIFKVVDATIKTTDKVTAKPVLEAKEKKRSGNTNMYKKTPEKPHVDGEYASKIKDQLFDRPMLKKKSEQIMQYDEMPIIDEVVNKNSQVKSFIADDARKVNSRYNRVNLPKFDKDTERTRIFRHELKYYINEADYTMLRNSLNCLLKHDENADEKGEYYIRSLYFDDYMNTALVDKRAGIENRRKYRVRIYGLRDNFIRLERKNKTKDFISKDNLTLSKAEYDSIIVGDMDFLLKKNNPLAHDFYYEMKTKKLKPAVIVDYVREAYVHPIRNLRITFDRNVKSGRYDTSIFSKDVALAPALPPGSVVLEVKFEKGLPDYIIGVLNSITTCRREAISKYALCRKYEG